VRHEGPGGYAAGVGAIAPDVAVRAAAELMRSRQVNHLLVTDEHDRLIGVLTDRDLKHSAFLPFLARHLAWDERRLRAPRVRDVMTWRIVTIEPDADLVRAGLLMFDRRIGSLPVIDQGRLVGIITERTILEAFRAGTQERDLAELFLG
jgi:acetoin utilization protein AcuB